MDEIYERLSLIINRELNVTLTVFNESGDIIYTEKMTAEQYHKRNFKKKYNFVPDKDGSTKGTITVDGRRYKVDLNREHEVGHFGDIHNGTDTIYLGKDMFKLSGSGNRDFVLQHEIGHQNLHSISDPNSNITEEDLMKRLDEEISSRKKQLKEKLKRSMLTGSEKDDAQRFISMSMPQLEKKFIDENPVVKKKLNQLRSRSKDDTDNRNRTRSNAKKYDMSKDCDHANSQEFEADRYGANKTSDDNMKSALTRMYKDSFKRGKSSVEKVIEQNKSLYNRDINQLKKDNSHDRMTIKKSSLELAKLERHPDEDPSHKKRDALKWNISRLSNHINSRNSEIYDTKNRRENNAKANKSVINELRRRMNTDIDSRIRAIDDNNLKNDKNLK